MRLVSTAWVLAAVTWAGAASAQQTDSARAAARDLGYAGVESFQGGDYTTAAAKLDKAYQVLQVPSLGLWSARALIKTNKWVEAAERLRQVIALEPKGGDAAVQEQARKDAKLELDALLPRIPKLVVQLQGGSAQTVHVTVDGEPLSPALIGEAFLANPGKHAVVGKLEAQEAHDDVMLTEAAQGNVVLRFSDAPSSSAAAAPAKPTTGVSAVRAPEPANAVKPSSARALVGWVLVGTGAAGVAVGATTGLLANGKKSDLEGSGMCRSTLCLPPQQDKVDSYNSLRTISTIGFYAGAALAATGIVLVLTAPAQTADQTSSAALYLSLSPRGGSLSGSF